MTPQTLLLHSAAPHSLSDFQALSLCTLKDTMAKLKPSSPPDFMPARVLKEVFNSVGPTI